jgi:hypothetical protein
VLLAALCGSTIDCAQRVGAESGPTLQRRFDRVDSCIKLRDLHAARASKEHHYGFETELGSKGRQVKEIEAVQAISNKHLKCQECLFNMLIGMSVYIIQC